MRKRLLPLIGGAAGALLLLGFTLGSGCSEPGTVDTSLPPELNAFGEECACGEAECGFDGCGNACGTCAGEGAMCWSGVCDQAAALGCDLQEFTPATEAAYTVLSGGKFRLTFVASTDTPADQQLADSYDEILQKMRITLRHDAFFGDNPPFGEFELGEQNWGDDCDLCVTAFDLCNDSGCAPSSTFLPVSGTIVIESAGEPGEPFRATIKNARFQQYWVQSSSGTVKELPNSKSWCIDNYRIDVDVPALSEASGNCLPDGSGRDIGDNIRDYTLQNCLGDDINLHGVCGVAKAVYIIASAEW